MYKPGYFVILQSSLLPLFGEIKDIIVFSVDIYIFVLQKYRTECFFKSLSCL